MDTDQWLASAGRRASSCLSGRRARVRRGARHPHAAVQLLKDLGYIHRNEASQGVYGAEVFPVPRVAL
jgi:hypothetical protein